jgi:hypothetical protein
MSSWVEKTSRFSKDGALIPRSIRLRKSTEISSSSANCSWLMLRPNRMVLMRLPNFSRSADKRCTCGPNVAHTQLSHHRMRLRVVMRLRAAASCSGFRSPLTKCSAPPSLGKWRKQGKTESAPVEHGCNRLTINGFRGLRPVLNGRSAQYCRNQSPEPTSRRRGGTAQGPRTTN